MKDLVKMNPDLGLLAIRLSLGSGFLVHGVAKFQDLAMTVGFFGKIGLPPFMAYVIATVETLSGAAMLLGMYTQIAGFGIMAVMLGAIYTVKAKMGFMGGYEIDFAYLMGALGIVLNGPGKHTVSCFMKKPAASSQPQA